MNIPATKTNQKSEGLGKAELEEVVTAIREDGYVVIEQVVDHDHLDVLKERMDEDSKKLIEAEEWGGSGSVRGHLQQGPPPFEPFLFADILVHPIAIQVTRQILGDSFCCSFYNGNTNTPGSGVQPLHGDGRHLWGEQPEAPSGDADDRQYRAAGYDSRKRRDPDLARVTSRHASGYGRSRARPQIAHAARASADTKGRSADP